VNSDSEPADLIRRRVRAEQMRILFEQSPPAIVISVLVAALVSAVLWDESDHGALVAWFTVIAALAAARLLLFNAYRRPTSSTAAAGAGERWFVVSHLVVAAVWGVGGWMILPAGSTTHQAIVYFFLMGMVSGAVATYSAHVGLVTASIALIIAPATIAFIFQPVFALRAMAAGGVVYTLAAYRATRLLDFFLRRSFRLSHELKLAHDAAQQLARTDELTGLNNRRAFLEVAGSALKQARRYGRPLSITVFDVDHFKRINDLRGHAAGDEALRMLASSVTSTIRLTDVAGRLGGEEFAVLLPETAPEEAAHLAERLRVRIGESVVTFEGGAFGITASFGLAGLSGETSSLEALLAEADAAQYRAKSEGRNRVVPSAATAASVCPQPE
jgi:diguanylate cyclase (GGDEF)-like protein